MPFYGLGVDQAAGFLYWDYSKEKTRLNAFISTTVILTFWIGLTISLIGAVAGPWLLKLFIKDAEHFTLWPYFLLVMVYPFFMTVNRIFLYYYRNEGSIKKYALLNVSTLVLITAGSIAGVIVFRMGSAGAVEGRTIGFCGIVLFFCLYELKKIGVHYDGRIARPLLKMGGPLFVSTIIGSVAYVGDRLIVEELGTLEKLGIYGFSVTIASVIEILLSALTNSFSPGVYKTLSTENTAEYENARLQLFIFVYTLIGAVVFAIAVIAPFTRLFIAADFFEAVKYIPLLCLSFIPRTFTQLYSLKFYKTKKPSVILWLNVAYLVTVMGAGIPLYKWLGLPGICLSVFITSLMNMSLAWFFSRRVDGFDYGLKKPFVLFMAVAAAICALLVIPQNNFSVYFLYCLPLLVFLILSATLLKKECSLLTRYAAGAYRRLLGRDSG